MEHENGLLNGILERLHTFIYLESLANQTMDVEVLEDNPQLNITLNT